MRAGYLNDTYDEIEPARSRAKFLSNAAKPPLPLEWCSEIEPQLNALWLVKKLLPAMGLALLYGHSGSGKSWVAIDWAFHVALGWDWNGRRVRSGLVIYVAAEGGPGVRNRFAAFRRYHGFSTKHQIPLALIPCPIDMQATDADTPRLIAAIREAAALKGASPALIVIDTLSKTFGAGKENTDDMVPYVANCQRVASEFDCCVMPVHHRPKDSENETPRGHGSLNAGVDTVILIEGGSPRRIRVTKQRDAELATDIGFNLESVSLGDDEDGEPVTSCVVNLCDGPLRMVAKGRKLNVGQTIAFTSLSRAIAECGEDAPSGLPADVSAPARVASLSSWKEQAFATMLKPDSKPDSVRRTFERYCDTLQSIGAVMVWEGFAWPLPL